MKTLLAAGTGAVLLLVAVGLSTNSIDPTQFSWDLRYYIEMAEEGLGGQLASPFAYRYATPVLVHWSSLAFGVPVEIGFAGLAYFGAFLQLLAIFVFTHWYTRSKSGAWVAMLITGFSLFNIKFLLFDTFRPDHLAYPLIVLQAYLALTGRFGPLLVATIIGCQIREFNAIPLIAYVAAAARPAAGEVATAQVRRNRTQIAASIAVLAGSFVLPRLLIPVSEDFQFASFTSDGFLRAILAPLVVPRDMNFLYSVAAYLLPLLVLANPTTILSAMRRLDRRDQIFFGVYGALVAVFSFFGGTDFFRFSTYLMLPQAVLVGILVRQVAPLRSALAIASAFVFNRIWLPFPTESLDAYLDFYGGYGTRFNRASLLRLLEWAGFLVLGYLYDVVARRRRPYPTSSVQ